MKTQKSNKDYRFTPVMNMQVTLNRESREFVIGLLIGKGANIDDITPQTTHAQLVRRVQVATLGRELLEEYDRAMIDNYLRLFEGERCEAMINFYYDQIGEPRPATVTSE